MSLNQAILRAAVRAAAGGAVTLAATGAFAGHVSGVNFLEQAFTVNPGAVGEPQGPFTARFVDFSYRSDLDQQSIAGTDTANFQENGVGFFSTFQADLGVPVNARVSGLNDTYKLYAVFNGTGTTARADGGLTGVFRTFDVTFRVDRDANTTFVGDTTELTGLGDDVDVLRGTLRTGGFHVFMNLANGDLNVQFDASTVGGFFGGEAFATGRAIGDFNDVNTNISGVVAPPGSFVRARINGSGNISAMSAAVPVPVPSSLALLGLGMLALTPVARRKA